MGHSQSDKLATHQRILEVASRRFRESGLDGISVAELMKEAGLTVGGFYKHFQSKDSLVVEAFSFGLRDLEPIEAALKERPGDAMRMYLSESHRDRLGSGCSISALVNDMPRAAADVRNDYTNKVAQIIELLVASLPASEPTNQQAEAMVILCTSVGAIALSRAVSDTTLSKQLLETALSHVLDLFSERDISPTQSTASTS